MNNRGWTIPFVLIALVIIGVLTAFLGWKVLIYVAGLFVAITFFVWIYDLFTRGDEENTIEEGGEDWVTFEADDEE